MCWKILNVWSKKCRPERFVWTLYLSRNLAIYFILKKKFPFIIQTTTRRNPTYPGCCDASSRIATKLSYQETSQDGILQNTIQSLWRRFQPSGHILDRPLAWFPGPAMLRFTVTEPGDQARSTTFWASPCYVDFSPMGRCLYTVYHLVTLTDLGQILTSIYVE